MRRFCLLVCAAPLALASGCFAPDIEAVHAKVAEECGFTLAMPDCAAENADDVADPGVRRVFERFVEDMDSEREQACFLDVDCSEDAASGAVDVNRVVGEMNDCMALEGAGDAEESAPGVTDEGGVSDEERDCVRGCGEELAACGDAVCGADVVDACLDDDRACTLGCAEQPG